MLRKANGLAFLLLMVTLLVTQGCKPKTEGDPAPDPSSPSHSPDLSSDDSLIHKINGAAAFESFVKSAPVTVVDFTAVWCGPCRELAPEMEKMAVEFADRDVKFAMIDIDKNKELASQLKINAIPHIMVFVNGEEVGVIDGNDSDEIHRRIEKALEGDKATTADKTTEETPSAPTEEKTTTLPGADGQIKKLTPSDSFDEVIQSATIVVIDFNATWCGPCKQLGPYLERMAKSYRNEDVSFFSADTDEMGELAQELGISSIPDVRVYVNGQPAGKVIGCEPVKIMGVIDSAIQSTRSGADVKPEATAQ